MRVSVALTTYNGEKYITNQLESIRLQTHPPDEVIISDDVSTDNTIFLIEAFIKNNQLSNWMLIKNCVNKGWQKNFCDTIALTTGDVIFCSDQDDIWLENKIEIMTKAISENDKILCLSGKIITIDENENEIDTKNMFLQGNRTGKLTYYQFTKKFNSLVWLGCTMCFTKDIVQIIKELGVNLFDHDAQICRIAAIYKGAYRIDYPVIKYRLHSNNTSNISMHKVCFGSSTVDKRIDYLSRNKVWLMTMVNYLQSVSYDTDIIETLISTIKFLEIRIEFLKNKNICLFIYLLKYLSYYSNFGMYLGDFCYCFNLNDIGGRLLWSLRKILPRKID